MSDEEKGKNEIPSQEDKTKSVSGTSYSAPLIAKAVANIIAGSSIITFPDIVLSSEKKKSIAEEKAELMKELAELDVDPETFDALLTNELDRKLKVSFGVAFLILTCLFTIASYAIVILDAIYDWGISEIAITALVIETPIQFIGLLYIIARNLFPQSEVAKVNKFGQADRAQYARRLPKALCEYYDQIFRFSNRTLVFCSICRRY